MDFCFNLWFLCVVYLIAASDAETSDINNGSSSTQCILPPNPEHGSYTSSAKGAPGDSLDTFQLNVTCNRGYKLTSIGDVSCSRGVWTERMPKCRSFCLPPRMPPVPNNYCVFASGEVYMEGDNNTRNANERSKAESNKSASCILPASPEYGWYANTPAGVPGDSLEAFDLTVFCELGFELTGSSNVSCSSGIQTQPMPKCLAPCYLHDNIAEVINCDVTQTSDFSDARQSTTTTKTTDANNLDSCKLPPYPEHGRYTSFPDLWPEATAPSFQLNVTCHLGYSLVGDKTVSCIYGMIDKEMPVCLPYCAVGGQSTVTCEKDAPRCVLASEDQVLLSSRVGSEPDCGIPHLHSRRKRLPVSGGFTPKPFELPWHVGVYRKIPEPIEQICGGTIISKRVVISAAHCFTTSRKLPPASNYALAAGKIRRSWYNKADSSQRTDVQEIKIPPRYQGAVGNFQEDISVVISVDEFEFDLFLKPACLSFDPKFDEEQLQEGQLGKIAGWGLTDEESSPSSKLRAAKLPYINIEKCLDDSPVSFRSSITGDKICAGYTNGTSACRGDSGGGIVFPAYESYVYRYFLRGVISTSPVNDKDCNIYTWVTFTHVLEHADFIKSATVGLL